MPGIYFCVFVLTVSWLFRTHAADAQQTEGISLGKYCNGSKILINSAAILTLNAGDLRWLQCTATLESRWVTSDNRLTIQILSLNALCKQNTHLVLFEGLPAQKNVISYPNQICTDGLGNYQTTYLTGGKTATLQITVTAQGTEDEVSMSMLVTATGYSHEAEIADFRCVNNLRVLDTLRCDTHDNCGDGSDESKDLCDWDKVKINCLSAFLGIGWFLLIITCLLLCWVCKENLSRKPDDDSKKKYDFSSIKNDNV